MFKNNASQIRLFICSFCLTLILVFTLSAFVFILIYMDDTGITTARPAVTQLKDHGLVIATENSYHLIRSDELTRLEQMRRRVDPLTIPRSIRLFIRVYETLDQVFS